MAKSWYNGKTSNIFIYLGEKMSGKFLKFKEKLSKVRCIKSVLAGLSAGTFLGGAALLLANYGVVNVKPMISLPIGLLACVLVFFAVYLLSGLTDEELARRLDKRLGFEERVGTMVEYSKESGTIVELQRQDTARRLMFVPTGRMKFGRLWLYILCLVLGVATLAAALVFKPEGEGPAEDPEIPFAISDFQITAMEELIEYVSSSEMQSPYRENVAIALTELLAELRQVDSESKRDAALEKALDAIYDETDDSSYAVEIMDALWLTGSDSVKALAKAINYYDWKIGDEWDDYLDKISAFRAEFVYVDESGSDAQQSDGQDTTDDADELKKLNDTVALLLGAGTDIELAVVRIGTKEDDALAVQLLRLASSDEAGDDGAAFYGLTKLADLALSDGYDDAQAELDSTCASIRVALYIAAEQNMKNTETGEYAMTRLKELFGCKLPRFKRPSFVEQESGGSNQDSDGNLSYTDSDKAYGSDDLVLDPYTGEYVEYGTILDDYYERAFAKLEDGGLTEEEKDAIIQYYNILKVGFGTTEEE